MGLEIERAETEKKPYKLPRVIDVIPERSSYIVTDPSPSAFRLDFGVQPFGVSEEIDRIEKEVRASEEYTRALRGYNRVDPAPAIEAVKERFRIGLTARVVFSTGGSDEILERIDTQLFRPRYESGLTKFIGVQPQYPHFAIFMDRNTLYNKQGVRALDQRFTYEALEIGPASNTPYDEVIQELADDFSSKKRRNIVFYVCNPNSPTGGVANFDTIKRLIDVSVQVQERVVIVDEAFGDAVEDENSAIPLTEEYPNLIVLRSLSKSIGFPGLRVGYTVMSEQVGKKYEYIRRVCDLAPTQLAANRILRPDIIERHLRVVREKTVAVKSALLAELKRQDIKYFPTDPRVPILYIDGRHPNFYANLRQEGVETTTGFATYGYDSPDVWFIYSGNKMNLRGRCIRMVIPKNTEDIPEIVERLVRAKKAA